MDKRKNTPKWLIASLSVLVVAAALFAVLFSTGTIGKHRIIKTPDISNILIDDAVVLLKENGLTISVDATEIRDDVDENTILAQSPKAGEKIKKGSAVNVVISEKATKIVVPDVSDSEKDLAIDILKKEGLKVEVKEEYNSKVPAGAVIKQSISGGSTSKSGSTIEIVVSKGEKDDKKPTDEIKKVEVPSVIGKSKEDAKKFLNDKNLKLKIVAYEYNESIKNGSVISQTPSEKTTVNVSDTVSVTISLGKKADSKITVPNVVFKTKTDAVEILSKKGFAVKIEEKSSDVVAAGCVITQSVNAGGTASFGSTITLVVSIGKETKPEKTTKTTAPSSIVISTTTKSTTKPNTTKPVTTKPNTTKPVTVPSTIPTTRDYSGEAKYIADFKITTDKTSAKAGDIITVSVSLKTNYGIFVIMLPVIYDGDVFEMQNTSATNPKSYLTFKGDLGTNYTTNGNWKSPAEMYRRSSNPDYWRKSEVMDRWKISYSSWAGDPSKSRTPVTLTNEETIVTFQMKVKNGVKNTDGRIFISPEFKKTTENIGGMLSVGRCVDNVFTTNYVDRGQTLNLANADIKVKIN